MPSNKTSKGVLKSELHVIFTCHEYYASFDILSATKKNAKAILNLRITHSQPTGRIWPTYNCQYKIQHATSHGDKGDRNHIWATRSVHRGQVNPPRTRKVAYTVTNMFECLSLTLCSSLHPSLPLLPRTILWGNRLREFRRLAHLREEAAELGFEPRSWVLSAVIFTAKLHCLIPVQGDDA